MHMAEHHHKCPYTPEQPEQFTTGLVLETDSVTRRFGVSYLHIFPEILREHSRYLSRATFRHWAQGQQ